METVSVNGVIYETQPIHLPKDYLSQFNFLDLGAKHGKMREWCQNMFGTDNGLHIEMSEEHIEVMNEKNIPNIQADISNLTFDENCVDFTVCTHTIEHLPSLKHIQNVIENSIKVSRQFCFFTWPFFDKDEYLSQYDLIPFYSTWDGHSTQITVKQFFELCQDIGIDEKNILCTYRERINDSNHKAILHIDSPADSDVWREEISLPKPYIEFEEDVYYETMVIIGCGSDEQNQNLFKSFTG